MTSESSNNRAEREEGAAWGRVTYELRVSRGATRVNLLPLEPFFDESEISNSFYFRNPNDSKRGETLGFIC